MPSKIITKLDLAKEMPRGGSGVYHIAFSPDGERFAVAYWNKNLAVFSAQDQKPLWKAKGPRGTRDGVSFSSDSKLIATCGPSEKKLGAQVVLWDAAKGKILHSVDSKVEDEDGDQIGFLADGSSAICKMGGSDAGDRIVLIRVSSGKLTTFLSDEDDIHCFGVSPTGDEVAVGRDKALEFRSLNTGKCRKRVALPSSPELVAFSPDGKLAAASCRIGATIALVESKTGKVQKTIKHLHQDINTCVHALEFDQEAGELVAVHGRGPLYALDLKTGKQLAAFSVPVSVPNINHTAAVSLKTGFYADVSDKARIWRLR